MLGKVLYWLTVLLIALLLVIGLVLLLESWDDSTIQGT